MSKKSIGFLIVFGPEVRAFIHSGLIKKLAEKYEVSIFTMQPQSDAFRNIDYAAVYQMPRVSESQLLVRLRAWSRRSQQAWLQKKGFSTWRHLIPTSSELPVPWYRRLWHSLFQNASWYYFGPIVERLVARHLGTQPTWREIYSDLDLNCLVSASLKGETILPALQTAQNTGCKIVGILNSWKEIFVSSYISVVPDKIVMPNKISMEFLLAVNPHVLPSKVSVSTTLYFEKILHPDRVLSRSEFCAAVGLDSQRPFICYTAATPLAVSGEIEIIHEIVSMLKEHPDRPQLLLRQNPMDDSDQFVNLPLRYPHIVTVQKPIWEWNPRENWMSTLEDDVSLWFNTIYHSVCNVSIPSTVTMEFSAAKKPVVNICFDLVEETTKEDSIRRFWDAPFYEEIKQSGYAIPTFSPNELNAALRHVTDNSFQLPEASFFPTRHPVDNILREIDAVLEAQTSPL